MLIKVLALKNLEQLLLEYPDFGFYLVKEYSETIKTWHARLSYDSTPRIERLARAVEDLLAPKMTLLSMKDWTNSMYIDHMFVSATDFYHIGDSQGRQSKGHLRWDSNTSTLQGSESSIVPISPLFGDVRKWVAA